MDLSLLRPQPFLSPFSNPFPRSRPYKPLNLRCSVSGGSVVVGSSTIEGGGGGKTVAADCVIVGGGISGLCIAQALVTKHPDAAKSVMVTEAKDRVGGNIITREEQGFLWEEGPNSFQPSDPMLTMVVDSGLKDDLVLGDPTAPRFVLWNGKLRPVPSKLTDLPFFDLMSIGGKIRAGFGAIGIRPSPPGREESVEEFVRRNLGDEVFERLIEPFCSGVYAGDPAKLSMKAAFGKVWKLEENGGSIIGGAFKAIQARNKAPKTTRDPRLPKPKGQTVGSFRKGLTMLPEAISARYSILSNVGKESEKGLKMLGDKVKVSWKLSSISKLPSGGYSLTYETPEGIVTVQSKSVVMTVPSHVASSLLRPLSVSSFQITCKSTNRGANAEAIVYFKDSAAEALSKLYYPPVAAVSISYPKEAIRSECLIDGELKGFGQLHPRTQKVETLGTIYSSSLFPNRAPPGRVLLLNYIGGATNTGILSKSEGELVEAVDRDLRKMLIKPSSTDPLVLGVKVWPQAIPQFLIGHIDLVDAAKASLSSSGHEGLFLGGNYVAGVALGRCVEGAYETATQVNDFMSRYAYK
ncbi:hypothetical protein YC2023_056420 [Brassica napus]